jgi:hypothetical protein
MEKKKCKFCDKEIEGYTEDQINYLMNQHILSKHKDKFEVSKK